MKRRDFISLFGTGLIIYPSFGLAQGPKKHVIGALAAASPESAIPRIGVLWPGMNKHEEGTYVTALVQGFKDLGYVDGKNIMLENRFAATQYKRFDVLAAELVAEKVDVIVSDTGTATLAAQRATAKAKIPVVFVLVTDPVGLKLAHSLTHPGGNLTGIAAIPASNLAGKRMELLKDAVPSLSRVAVLLNPKDPYFKKEVVQYRAAAAALGLAVQEIQAADPNSIESAISAITADRSTGLVVSHDPMLFHQRKHIAELAVKHRLPSISFTFEMAEAGLLMSYGSNFLLQFRQAPVYVDKILKGAKPADLPIEQPVKVELVINLKTAKALGLTLPPMLLALADRVIS